MIAGARGMPPMDRRARSIRAMGTTAGLLARIVEEEGGMITEGAGTIEGDIGDQVLMIVGMMLLMGVLVPPGMVLLRVEVRMEEVPVTTVPDTTAGGDTMVAVEAMKMAVGDTIVAIEAMTMAVEDMTVAKEGMTMAMADMTAPVEAITVAVEAITAVVEAIMVPAVTTVDVAAMTAAEAVAVVVAGGDAGADADEAVPVVGRERSPRSTSSTGTSISPSWKRETSRSP